MDRIHQVKKLTDNPYLNLYQFSAAKRDGEELEYYVSSRTKQTERLRAVTHDSHPDGVVIYGVYGENKDRIVLVRQYRYPVGDYVYEFPAGLVESGEDIMQAGIREMFEETGLTFHPISGGAYQRSFFTSVGMTDESCGTCFGYCEGTPTNANQEDSEDIQVVLADRAECRRILKEENVAIMCAYMLMHFIAGEGDPLKFIEEK